MNKVGRMWPQMQFPVLGFLFCFSLSHRRTRHPKKNIENLIKERKILRSSSRLNDPEANFPVCNKRCTLKREALYVKVLLISKQRENPPETRKPANNQNQTRQTVEEFRMMSTFLPLFSFFLSASFSTNCFFSLLHFPSICPNTR